MAEGTPLLREYRAKSSIEGSNPSLSAIIMNEVGLVGCYRWVEVAFEPSIMDLSGSTDAPQADRNGRRPARRVSPRKRTNNPSLSAILAAVDRP